MNIKNSRHNMVREPYRALFSTGRTYAAFEKKTTLPLIDQLMHHKVIIDPMAGYGSLMNFCSEIGIATCNIEYNPPAYLWGVLNNPKYSDIIIEFIDSLIHKEGKFRTIRERVDVSDLWFSPLSYNIISDLFRLIYNISSEFIDENHREEISLALLLPFVGRLACYVPGNVVANVKQGGMCIYTGIPDDFDNYLMALKEKIDGIKRSSINKNHEFIFGDLRTIKLENKFSAFITSPPYPNSRDYFKMFAPENECLLFLKSQKLINGLIIEEPLISCVCVSEYRNKNIDYINDISSESARTFIEYLVNFKGKKQAKYDMSVYYIPYFSNYFYSMERAYRNFASYLTDNAEGYIIVVNNTARDKIIPVAESTVEVFNQMGFKAKKVDIYTRELSHVGSINPRVKGFKAKHTEYTIKVWRG
jgi:hypothetical protein